MEIHYRIDNPTTRNLKGKTYDFPNATLFVSKNRITEHPKWCVMINCPRTRTYAANALQQLRIFRRAGRAASAA
jgi:hypothetical protein